MRFRAPKNTEKYEWTRHAVFKMKQYSLTAQRILRVVKNPQRVEKGIVKNTIAVMQPASTRFKNGRKTWSREIWAMYQLRGSEANSKPQKQKVSNTRYKILNTKYKIISAWRYPGVSPKRDPIPEDILRELKI